VTPIARLSGRRSKRPLEDGWKFAAIPPFLKKPLAPGGTPIAELLTPPAWYLQQKPFCAIRLRFLTAS
jgi:hypothetical protein